MEVVGGNVGKAEMKVTKNGKQFLSFSVAENKGFGDAKETIWYDCVLWSGDAQAVQKGDKVVVFGHKSERTYQDKVYNNIDVFHVIHAKNVEVF